MAARLTPRQRGNGYVARIPHELPDATFGSVWGDGEALQLQQFGRFPPFQRNRVVTGVVVCRSENFVKYKRNGSIMSDPSDVIDETMAQDHEGAQGPWGRNQT